jgi:hypothetical protein
MLSFGVASQYSVTWTTPQFVSFWKKPLAQGKKVQWDHFHILTSNIRFCTYSQIEQRSNSKYTSCKLRQCPWLSVNCSILLLNWYRRMSKWNKDTSLKILPKIEKCSKTTFWKLARDDRDTAYKKMKLARSCLSPPHTIHNETPKANVNFLWCSDRSWLSIVATDFTCIFGVHIIVKPIQSFPCIATKLAHLDTA